MYVYPVIEKVAQLCKAALDGDKYLFIAIGGSSVEQPFMCHIGELPQNVTVSDPASSTVKLGGASGVYELQYDVTVTLWADRVDLVKTSEIVTGWWELIARAVAADRTLGHLVQHAQPYMTGSWSGRNQKRGTYLVAIEGGVRVRQTINPISEED